MNGEIKEWVAKEFSGLCFGSVRLERRFKKTMSDISEYPEKSIWLSSGSRSNAKAVYRMLGNERFDKKEILSAHRNAVDIRNEEKILLAVQDTMSVNYSTRENTEGMGYNCEQALGINVHSCLYITPQGIPMGVADQSVTTRKFPVDERSHHEKRMRKIEDKESYRWLETMKTAAKNAPENVELVHIADREGDIYELYAAAMRSGQKFVIRAIHNRMTIDGQHILDELNSSTPKGDIKLIIPENHKKKTKERESIFELRFINIDVKKPQIRSKDNNIEDSLKLSLISLKETNSLKDQEKIEWILMTNLELSSCEAALTAIEYYHHRWKIERFHYVLKSGCEIEKIQQHSVDRIEMMILMYSIISIHIMMLTYISRNFPDTPCELIFSESEWKTLYRAANKTKIAPDMPYSIADAVKYVAKLGGWVGAPSDGPPGLKVVWFGLNALFILNNYRDFI